MWSARIWPAGVGGAGWVKTADHRAVGRCEVHGGRWGAVWGWWDRLCGQLRGRPGRV